MLFYYTRKNYSVHQQTHLKLLLKHDITQHLIE